jgi:hypothetical protein
MQSITETKRFVIPMSAYAELGVAGAGNVGNPMQVGPDGRLGEHALLQMQRRNGGGAPITWNDIGAGGRMRR